MSAKVVFFAKGISFSPEDNSLNPGRIEVRHDREPLCFSYAYASLSGLEQNRFALVCEFFIGMDC